MGQPHQWHEESIEKRDTTNQDMLAGILTLGVTALADKLTDHKSIEYVATYKNEEGKTIEGRGSTAQEASDNAKTKIY